MSIATDHLDFVLRTKKKITYNLYYKYRVYLEKTDEEIEKCKISRGGNNRYEGKTTITLLYKEAVKNGFNKSFSYFYTHKLYLNKGICFENY